MKQLMYKGASLAVAGSMLVASAPLYANSNEVQIKLHQQIGQQKNVLQIELYGFGQDAVALELGIVADDVKAIKDVLWSVAETACETHQLIALEDEKEKLIFYVVAENKDTPLTANDHLKMQISLEADEKLIFNEEAFYIKVIEKGYDTHLYESLDISYSEEIFTPAEPEQPVEPGKPEGGSSGGSTGGGNSGSSTGTSDDDDSTEGSGASGNTNQKPNEGSSNEVYEDITIKPGEGSSVSFKDVENHWAKSAIAEMAAKGIIKGYEDGNFKPSATITRGEFATLLARAFQIEAKTSKQPFADIQTGKWYTEGVAALYEAGITSGRPDGTFGVNSPITNEEICTMIDRALKVLNMDLADLHSQPVSFKDSAQISSYAKEAVETLYQKGVIRGNADGSFAPKSPTSRAQVAVMLNRIFELAK